MRKMRCWELFFSNNLFANHSINALFSNVNRLYSPASFLYSLPVKYSIDRWALQLLVIAICFLYLLSLDQDMLHQLVFKTTIWIREDGRRMNTRYLCRIMKNMAIIACKLHGFSALEYPLKLKSMLNISSNKIWKQILQQWNDIESLSLLIRKHRVWS